MMTLFKMLSAGVLFLLTTSAYSQQLVFTYDGAGNQTTRNWICINCRPSGQANAALTEALKVEVKVIDSAKNVFFKRTVTASPNPFLENLNISWQTEEGVSVKQVTVFNIGGSKAHVAKIVPFQNAVTLPFQRLAVGTYVVYVTFSDNRRESIKVIKK